MRQASTLGDGFLAAAHHYGDFHIDEGEEGECSSLRAIDDKVMSPRREDDGNLLMPHVEGFQASTIMALAGGFCITLDDPGSNGKINDTTEHIYLSVSVSSARPV